MIPYCSICWDVDKVKLLDQRRLPAEELYLEIQDYRDIIEAIRTLAIRGAPAIGVAAAMGLALGARSIRTENRADFLARFKDIGEEMLQARPTAVNLRWAIKRMIGLADDMAGHPIGEIKDALRKESETILAEDIAINRQMGMNGQVLIPDGATVLTHCNAGALATGGYGTALGVIRAAWEKGKRIQVIADETRPWLQGLRLTAFELMEDKIPVSVIADNAAGSLMRQKRIDLVITGADRIAANGDVANKIGTYQVAVLAKVHQIPFYVAAPISTIDAATKNGDLIPVEQRGPEEIARVGGRQIGPIGVMALNPVFDVTPARYVSAIITETGIIRPPFQKGIREALGRGRSQA